VRVPSGGGKNSRLKSHLGRSDIESRPPLAVGQQIILCLQLEIVLCLQLETAWTTSRIIPSYKLARIAECVELVAEDIVNSPQLFF
jgi:hypothetical protein